MIVQTFGKYERNFNQFQIKPFNVFIANKANGIRVLK